MSVVCQPQRRYIVLFDMERHYGRQEWLGVPRVVAGFFDLNVYKITEYHLFLALNSKVLSSR